MEYRVTSLESEVEVLREELSQLRAEVSRLRAKVGTFSRNRGDTEAICGDIADWLVKCLAGSHRGPSGRDRIPLGSRLWLVARDSTGNVFDPVRVCYNFTDCKALLKRGSDAGDSIFIGVPSEREGKLIVARAGELSEVIAVCEIDGKLLVAVPLGVWHHRSVLRRVLPAQSPSKALTGICPPDRRDVPEEEVVKLWMGCLSPIIRNSMQETGDESVPVESFVGGDFFRWAKPVDWW